MEKTMIQLSDLEGRWHLSRQIEDHSAGLSGRFEGLCDWVADGKGLRQTETGVLHYGTAPPMQASRTYLWRQDGDGLLIEFEDGRPFHRIGPDGLSDSHWCPPDMYDVTYDLTGWPHWVQTWRVSGPRKDSTLVSRFSPA